MLLAPRQRAEHHARARGQQRDQTDQRERDRGTAERVPRARRGSVDGCPLRHGTNTLLSFHEGRPDPQAVRRRPAHVGHVSAIGRERGADVRTARLAMVLGAGLLVLTTASIARAEDDDPNAWHVTVIPYLWAAGLYGDITVHGVSAHLDASFADLLDHTDTLVGLQGHLELTRGPLGVYGDFFYVKTKVEDAGAIALDVTTRMWFVEFGARYRGFGPTTHRVPGP